MTSRWFIGMFAVAIILLPFNALPYFKFAFREMANEGAFFPILLMSAVCVINLTNGKKLHVPSHSSVFVLAIFIGWVVISGLANFLEISQAFTKGRSGIEKFIFQYLLLGFVVFTSLLVFQIGRKDLGFLYKFRRYATYSLVPVCLYCIVEVLAISGNDYAVRYLQAIDHYIRDEEYGVAIFRRLRSVSGEPSYFAMYISFIFPWIFSYLITEPKYRWYFLMLIIFLAGMLLLTFSRSAYGVVGLQMVLLIMGVIFYSRKKYLKKLSFLTAAVTITIILLTGVVNLDIVQWDDVSGVLFSLLDTESINNIGRYGAQSAAFNMAYHNPFFGVGFGQYGFNMPAYVPEWAKVSPEIEEWMSSTPDSSWAPALGLYARIAGELGYMGLAVWLYLWVSLLYSCYRQFKKNCVNLHRCDGLGLALLVSMVGILMAGLNSDSLRFFGYWMLLPLSWIYLVPVRLVKLSEIQV